MTIKEHPRHGFPVRSDGCVFVPETRYTRGHWTYGTPTNTGYLAVRINGRQLLVHRLVAETFLQNPSALPTVDHINRKRDDNRVENLRWASYKTQARNNPRHDAVDSRNGTHSYQDRTAFDREKARSYRTRNSEEYRRQVRRFRETHRNVTFNDGSRRYVPLEIALPLLKLPVKDRFPIIK